MTQLCYSYLCIDCEEIVDVRDIREGKCPRCGSKEMHPLSAWLPATKRRALVKKGAEVAHAL